MDKNEALGGDRTFWSVLLIVVTIGLLYALRNDLSPLLMGGAVLLLVLLVRRGVRFDIGIGTVTGVLLGVWMLTQVAHLLWPFAIAFVLAYLLAPLVRILSRYIPRVFAIGVIVLSVVGVLSGIGVVIIPKVIAEVGELVQRLPGYGNELILLYNEVLAWTQTLGVVALPIEDVRLWVMERLPELGKIFADQITLALKGISSGLAALLNVLMVPFVAFYLLKDYEQIGVLCKRMLPPRHTPVVWDVVGRIDTVLGQYVRGQMLVCSFIAVLTSVGLAISGIRYAVLLGIMAGLFNLAPYVGLIVSLSIASVVALLDADPVWGWVKVLIVFGIVQGIEANYLSPKVVGERVGLHPVWGIFALVIAAHFWGLIGMIVAIPVAAVINIAVRILIDRYFQSRYYGGIFEDGNK